MKEGTTRVVVVGASAAGLRCASRLARLKPEWQITVVEQQEVFSYAACGLPYVLSGDIEDIQSLRRSKDGMVRDVGYFSSVKGVKVLSGCQAIRIDGRSQKIIVENQQGSKELDYDQLVLASGARAKRFLDQQPHPRVRTFHTYKDVQPIIEDLVHGRIRKVAIVGAGLVGCELAEAFAAMWGADVMLIEKAAHPLPYLIDPEMGAIIARVLKDQQVDFVGDCMVERIDADDQGVSIGMNGESLRADAVVMALGVEPRVELAQSAGIKLGRTGAVAVDNRLATSVPNIWAAGDCVEVKHILRKDPVYMPLGSLANRQGRTLANLLAGVEDKFPAVVGTTAVKVFDWDVVACGINRSVASWEGLENRCIWVSLQDKADYWPEVKNIFIQLLYEAGSQKVLGVQAAGEGEVAKRIDVASQLLANGASLEELTHLEHAYAPPFAPALDPLAVAAMVALNQEDGVKAISPLSTLDGYRVLDVRHEEEVQSLPVGSIAPPENIPQEEIRARFGELENACTERDEQPKPLMAVCARGVRSAEVVRWMVGKGLEACYLGGGVIWRSLAIKNSGTAS